MRETEQKKRWAGVYGARKPTDADVSARQAAEPPKRSFARALSSRAPGVPTDNRLEQSTHLQGVTYVAIKVLSDQAASCNVECFRIKRGAKSGDSHESHEPLPIDHPLCRLMRRPNNKETGGLLRRRLIQQICLTGTALTWMLNNQKGMPGQLWCLPTGTVQALFPSPVWPQGAYRVTPYMAYGPFAAAPSLLGAGGAIIPAEEIIRADLPHPLVSYDAMSPMSACSLQLDALESVDKSRFHGMKQSIKPSAVLELDPSAEFPDDAEISRLSQAISGKYSGEHNVGRAAILSPGLKLSPWQGDNSAMGWENAWSQLCDFVMSVFGTTKTMAFMGEAGSYASLYASLQQFNLFSLTPLLSILADAINVQMVWPNYGEDYCVSFTPRKINDDDLLERQLSADASVGLRTINEVRILRGLPPVQDEWGNDRAYPGGAQAAAQAKQQEKQQAMQGGDNPLAALMGGMGGDEQGGDEQGGDEQGGDEGGGEPRGESGTSELGKILAEMKSQDNDASNDGPDDGPDDAQPTAEPQTQPVTQEPAPVDKPPKESPEQTQGRKRPGKMNSGALPPRMGKSYTKRTP